MAMMVLVWVAVTVIAAIAIARYAPGIAQGILQAWKAIFAIFGILVALYLLSSGATIAIFVGMVLLAIGVWKIMLGGAIPGV